MGRGMGEAGLGVDDPLHRHIGRDVAIYFSWVIMMMMIARRSGLGRKDTIDSPLITAECLLANSVLIILGTCLPIHLSGKSDGSLPRGCR